MPASAAIYGCQGPELAAGERAFFRDVHPFGFILLGINGNIDNPAQVAALCDQLRDSIGEANAPILIDQEGGRVQRLRPPHWQNRPPARRFGQLYEGDQNQGRDAAYLCARLIAHELRSVGVTVNCAPVLDVPVEGAHDIIGDRAYSLDPAAVVALGRATIEGYLDGGVLPVIKHIPGHGRANADSHLALPRVATPRDELSAHDFVTFRSLNHAPVGMTAHVVFDALDPRRPATTSPKVIRNVIRGEIGFDGLLLSDDLSMQALEGPIGARARAALLAGCDIALHCNGKLDEMMEVARESQPLIKESLDRANRALAQLRTPAELDVSAAEARLNEMLTGAVA
jgi:beta-N-acetylhexosaminidase